MNTLRSRFRFVGGGVIALFLTAGCMTAPRPTGETVRRSANPRAIVEGIVRDGAGLPAAGVTVRGLPREKDLAWSPAVVTDRDGRFRLVLAAPGEYGFLVSSHGITLVTPREDDPSRTVVSLRPGERRAGIALVVRREDFDGAIRSPRSP